MVVETSEGHQEHIPVPEENEEPLPDLGSANLLGTGPEEEAELREARYSEIKKMEGFEVFTPVLASTVHREPSGPHLGG